MKTSITEEMNFRQKVVEFAIKHDRTVESLTNKSRRPHSHPNQRTGDEIELFSKKISTISTRDWDMCIENALMQDINVAKGQCISR